MKFLISLILFTSTFSLHASLDDEVIKQITFFKIKPIPPHQNIANRSQIELGKKIFLSPIISGNKNISCLTCHNPKLGTSDGLSLSQTEDHRGVLKRNSLALYNTGLPTRMHMFWDGRVTYNFLTHEFMTPEPLFNGADPKRSDITKVMTSALSMQVLFPMVSTEEMKGKKGENEIANAKNNLEAWDFILKRIIQDNEFYLLLKKSYPDTNTFNIGHIGEALAQFIKEEFHSNNLPFFKYVNGNRQAISEKEKRGFLLFTGKGRCIACHQGGEFGLNVFYASVGTPQFGARPFSFDEGRPKIEGENFKKFFFRTPSLINLKVTGPYMHNGAFQTIREVINHYSDIEHSLNTFSISEERLKKFPVEIEIKNDQASTEIIFNSIQAPFLKNGINFTESEKDDLEAFLTNALMDPKFENYFIK